ncbi:MAG: nicotinate-nucleotide--dimethylbenzimidazole phosphoribosyltransferase [Chloroflexota bacterium]|nr:nicotinate-nucleotide--dimethylbenzimidazole phosphoribosyltransferase [Chloroflexota bacterium]
MPSTFAAADGASRLVECMARVEPLDEATMCATRSRLDRLTKPPGSLGRLERLAVQIAGITRLPRPHLNSPVVVVMAADHGVVSEGVSAYPAAVTAQMVHNFAGGGAAINVLARQAAARVVVVDVGVAASLPAQLPIVHRKLARGTANLAHGAAMTRAQMLAAIDIGLDLAVLETDVDHRADVICLGEMGIGNTTAASAMLAAITGLAVAEVTGRGTGIDDATWNRKVAVIERALRVNQPNRLDPLDVLARLGGLEIAALVGLTLGAAARRVPILVDGFIATVAALVAAELCPLARGYMIAAHRSVEIGHRLALERLELEALFAFDLRLGEGTGAALALPMLYAALAVLDEMATFEEAGVSAVPDSPVLTDNQMRAASNSET